MPLFAVLKVSLCFESAHPNLFLDCLAVALAGEDSLEHTLRGLWELGVAQVEAGSEGSDGRDDVGREVELDFLLI